MTPATGLGPAPAPGDILAVRSAGIAGRLIRLGAAIRDEPNLVNHVAIVHHFDARGTLWVIEGRPGGAGWRQAGDYLRSRWTESNRLQPKTAAQRKMVCDGAVALIGTRYDWEAIEDDAARTFGVEIPGWNPRFGTVPGHLVCSSYAAYLYLQAGLECPPGERNVSPADWTEFMISHGWEGGLP